MQLAFLGEDTLLSCIASYHFYCKLASSRLRDSRVREIEESPNTDIKPATAPLSYTMRSYFPVPFTFVTSLPSGGLEQVKLT